jgi:hypothetical protein
MKCNIKRAVSGCLVRVSSGSDTEMVQPTTDGRMALNSSTSLCWSLLHAQARLVLQGSRVIVLLGLYCLLSSVAYSAGVLLLQERDLPVCHSALKGWAVMHDIDLVLFLGLCLQIVLSVCYVPWSMSDRVATASYP